MATPTRAEVEAMWVNASNVLELIADTGSVDATNLIGLIDTLQQSYEGDYLEDIEREVSRIRSTMSGIIEPSAAQAVLRPFLKMYCKDVIGLKSVDSASDVSMLTELSKYLRDQARFVQSRVLSFGAASAAAGNIGTTQVIRLTKDRYNFDIESCWADQKRLRCILDHNTGRSKGNELWEIEGQSRLKDELKRSGSGIIDTMEGYTADDSLLDNAGFQSFGGTATAPTSITSWTPITAAGAAVTVNGTNFGFDSTNVFRPSPSDGSTSYSLKINTAGACNMTQKLSVTGAEIDVDTPYSLVVIYNSQIFSGQGTLVARLGNVNSSSVTITGQTGWQVLVVPQSRTWAHWYGVFAEDDLRIDVDFTGLSSGSVLLAEVMLIPGQRFDNHFFWVLPSNGNATYVAPRIDDQFNVTDTISDSSLVQKWVWKAWDWYLPHSNGSSIGWSGS